jgi:hypothetical protein
MLGMVSTCLLIRATIGTDQVTIVQYASSWLICQAVPEASGGVYLSSETLSNDGKMLLSMIE